MIESRKNEFLVLDTKLVCDQTRFSQVITRHPVFFCFLKKRQIKTQHTLINRIGQAEHRVQPLDSLSSLYDFAVLFQLESIYLFDGKLVRISICILNHLQSIQFCCSLLCAYWCTYTNSNQNEH